MLLKMVNLKHEETRWKNVVLFYGGHLVLAAQENLTEPALINLSLVGENDGSESVF
jgi:hypothetical protein